MTALNMKPQIGGSGLSTLSPRSPRKYLSIAKWHYSNVYIDEHTLTGRDFKSPQQRNMENSQSAFNNSGFGRKFLI